MHGDHAEALHEYMHSLDYAYLWWMGDNEVDCRPIFDTRVVRQPLLILEDRPVMKDQALLRRVGRGNPAASSLG